TQRPSTNATTPINNSRARFIAPPQSPHTPQQALRAQKRSKVRLKIWLRVPVVTIVGWESQNYKGRKEWQDCLSPRRLPPRRRYLTPVTTSSRRSSISALNRSLLLNRTGDRGENLITLPPDHPNHPNHDHLSHCHHYH